MLAVKRFCFHSSSLLLSSFSSSFRIITFHFSFRYCKPFEEEARRLAKTLVAVGDLLEVWQAAQADISLLLSAAVSSLIEGSSNLRVKHRQVKRR